MASNTTHTSTQDCTMRLRLINGATYNAIKVKGPARNRMNSVAVSSTSSKFYAAAADGRIFSGNYESLQGQPTGFENPYPNRIVALSRTKII
jgi:hypothetical protein